MKRTLAFLTALLLAPLAALHAAELTLKAPLDFQVVQRASPGKGLLRIVGELAEDVPAADTAIEARLLGENLETPWRRVGGSVLGRKLAGTVEAPAGGWWELEVRVLQGGKEEARGRVAHVGVGEVFVIAGQSNSANHGEEKQSPKGDRVVAFDGTAWRLAADPQPGASGAGGSFIPPFADAVVAKENVPVGIIACGIGATSVREWLPKGATFPNPPTIEGRVQKLPSGKWASKGDAYVMFVARMKSAGLHGFRAVLWHQGESDGKGVHFSGPGLREHGAKWGEKVLPWLDRQWTEPRKADGGTEWPEFAAGWHWRRLHRRVLLFWVPLALPVFWGVSLDLTSFGRVHLDITPDRQG